MKDVVYFCLGSFLLRVVTAWLTSLRLFGEGWAWLNMARLDFSSDEEILTLVLICGCVCRAGAVPVRTRWRVNDYVIDNSLIT